MRPAVLDPRAPFARPRPISFLPDKQREGGGADNAWPRLPLIPYYLRHAYESGVTLKHFILMGTYLCPDLRHNIQMLPLFFFYMGADFVHILFAQMRPVGHFVTRGG